MYDTREEVAALGVRDPEFTQYIKDHGLESMTSFTQLPGLDAGSGAMASLAGSQGYVVDVPMRDGHINPLRVHKPKTALPDGKRSPLVVTVYGGGFKVGDNTQMSPLALVLNALYGATVVNLTYRLVPDHRWPTQPNDVWDNLEWIVAHADELGADPAAGFVLTGGSAGGNLVAVTAQQWIARGAEPKLTGLNIAIPLLFVPDNVPGPYRDLWFSREQNSDAFVLDAGAVRAVTDDYAPDTASAAWCPLNAANHSVGFPRTVLSACGQDPLRDDALVYWRILRDHGADTRLDVAPGVPHAHALFDGLESANKSNFATFLNFGWLLRDEKTPEEVAKVLALFA